MAEDPEPGEEAGSEEAGTAHHPAARVFRDRRGVTVTDEVPVAFAHAASRISISSSGR